MALDFITPERALIFRITHIANVPWIFDHGLHCAASEVRDPDFRPIGSSDLIGKWSHRVVPLAPGGTLNECVAFYFTPSSPMLLNIKTGVNVPRLPMDEVAIFVSSLPSLQEQNTPYVFTDRHAYLDAAQFSSDLADLDWIDWDILRARDFARSDDDPGKMERYQAEALAHRHVPLAAILGIVCRGEAECGTIRREIEQRDLRLQVVARPGWYF